jgi:hypothetical protein
VATLLINAADGVPERERLRVRIDMKSTALLAKLIKGDALASERSLLITKPQPEQ